MAGSSVFSLASKDDFSTPSKNNKYLGDGYASCPDLKHNTLCVCVYRNITLYPDMYV